MIKAFLVKVIRFIFRQGGVPKDRFGKEIHFKNVRQLKTTPKLDDVNDQELVHIYFEGKSYWALFKCPCGCGEVISLPLMEYDHRNSWSLKINKQGLPSIYPSIWQNKGCFSHFWVEYGSIEWCFNTGREPWLSE